MARNKRKTVKDKDNLKTVRKQARRRWRNKKAQEKALKNAVAPRPAGLISSQKANTSFAHTNTEPKRRNETSGVKEINPMEIVRTEKSLGCGTFGVCYLAHYRSILVAVKEFRMKSESVNDVKRELLHEARMINHLGDHRNLPLLFGEVTKGDKLKLVTQFHGEKGQSLTLSTAIKKKKLDKPLG